jgi:hypothetical protein
MFEVQQFLLSIKLADPRTAAGLNSEPRTLNL